MTYLAAGATVSADELYRYALWRDWAGLFENGRRRLVWLMLNPSTADGAVDDPTIRRCVQFSRDHGHAGLVVINLYALRSPKPGALASADDPVGPDNDETIREVLESALTSPTVVCAWGGGGWASRERVERVLELVQQSGARTVCLGRTKNGHPRHPLYVRRETGLREYPR